MDAFQKKYPFIKVEIWRAAVDTLISKIVEEYKAGKHLSDVIEGTQLAQMILQKEGIIQPFYSPNSAYIDEDAIIRAPSEGIL